MSGVPGPGAVSPPPPPAPGAVSPPPPPPAATWYSGFSPEEQGYLQNKGWATAKPEEAASAMFRAYKEYETYRGIPQDQIVRFPKDAADAEGWKALRTRMGVPADAAGYKFEGVALKGADEGTNAKFLDSLRAAAMGTQLTPEQADGVAKATAGFIDAHGAALEAAQATAITAEKEALAKNWGANAEANTFVAKQAAAKLGVTAEHLAALENTIGYSKVMELFRSIGQGMGEDRFVKDPGPGGREVMTAEQAIAKRTALEQDKAWVQRYRTGDTTARAELEALLRIIISSQER